MSALKPSPHLGGFVLLKGQVPEGHCADCLTKHDAAQPLHWQYQFMEKHGRWPTWHDAMRHCSEEVKGFWLKELAGRGVVVGDDPGEPVKEPKFKVGERVRFQNTAKRCRSGLIYAVNPSSYALTLIFGRNHVNVLVPHEECWKA